MPQSPSPERAIAAARRLAPLIAAAAPRIEAARELPADLVTALHEAGLFRLLLPRALGGGELAPSAFVAVIEELARADAATAWVICQTAGCSMSAAYLDPPAAAHVFGDPRAVLAWGAGAVGRMHPVPGGFRVSGKWGFASGSRHATWLGGHCRVAAADGSLARDAEGRLFERSALFPREAAQIEDRWQVIGLRGTGSDSYAVEDLFVPAELTLLRDITAECRAAGMLYRFATTHLYASGFAAVALGIAREMLDAFIILARDKVPRDGSRRLAESPVVQAEIGRLEGRLRAARALLWATLGACEARAAEAPLGAAERIDIRLAASHALAVGRAVSEAVYHAAGVNAIFTGDPLERRFRDSHAVSQQVQARAAHFESVGQFLLGITSDFMFV